jgi:L-aspartate oxidase
MKQSYDIVIVGSGIGGLSTLLYLSETIIYKEGNLSICLLVKGSLNETNTNWAQGGIAAVKSLDDNFEKHINDTLTAGAFLNDKFIVEKVINSAPNLIKDLIDWGVQFDKKNNGEYDLAKEGGHSDARIWHKEDQTGKDIQSTLIDKIKNLSNVDIFENYTLINAEKVEDNTFSIEIFDNKNNIINSTLCSKLVIATGGIGGLFEKSTNQEIATGDGVFIASKLGAKTENLSFVQFHPTGLYQNGSVSFLITEALRGSGAILKNEQGEAFMFKFDERLELAPRDIVSRAIITEINQQKLPYVYLDATKIDAEIIENHYPNIKKECKLRLGINIQKEFIPVIPVQHYSCGGVKVNEYGETEISGLFAIGEVASTGLHGANRLASNSLLEAIAFAKFSVASLTDNKIANHSSKSEIEKIKILKVDKSEIQKIVSRYGGIIKSNEGLTQALHQLLEIKSNAIEIDKFRLSDFEANCILETAILLIQDALDQKENKGVYFNVDLTLKSIELLA